MDTALTLVHILDNDGLAEELGNHVRPIYSCCRVLYECPVL